MSRLRIAMTFERGGSGIGYILMVLSFFAVMAVMRNWDSLTSATLPPPPSSPSELLQERLQEPPLESRLLESMCENFPDAEACR